MPLPARACQRSAEKDREQGGGPWKERFVSFEIEPQKELADQLYTILDLQLSGSVCYDLAAILEKDREADLVFQLRLLKNGKLTLKVKIWDDNL